jgi:succinate dehydrogenase/fumarate reductase-like Fe-S protein
MHTTDFITLYIDGQPAHISRGMTVAAALAHQNRLGITRRSVSGQLRAPLCGMGICHECRVMINEQRVLACQTLCREGMHIRTDIDSNPTQARTE